MANAGESGITVGPGSALPLGVHDCCDGFNFAVFSRHAGRMEVLIFDNPQDAQPRTTVRLDAARHRTGDIWHGRVGGIDWGCAYTFRAYGPWAPEHGHRFDPRRALLDPYARAIVGTELWDFAAVVSTGEDQASERDSDPGPVVWAKCLIADNRFDWEEDTRPKRSWSETVIYETHVRGLTIHPSSAVSSPGTFLGVIEADRRGLGRRRRVSGG